MSYLANRNLSVSEKEKLVKYEDERRKVEEEKTDMKMFFLWVLETIVIR